LKPSSSFISRTFCTTIDPSWPALLAIQRIGLLDGARHDVHADLLIAAELQTGEDLRRPKKRHTAARHDPLLDCRLGRVHRIFNTRLLFLHLGLCGRPDFDDGNATDQLRQPLLQFLAVVVRRGVLDLCPELLHSTFDGRRRARPFDDRRVVFVDRDLLRPCRGLPT
jgi:hypothetical protein